MSPFARSSYSNGDAARTRSAIRRWGERSIVSQDSVIVPSATVTDRLERHSQERRAMQSSSHRVLLMAAILVAGCTRRPSRSEALAAIEKSSIGRDTMQVQGRVWQDGPPWFSCAEVITKFNGRADRATVRDQVGNWKSLVLAGWIVLRDSSKGVLADPGWCTARLTDEGMRRAAGWTPVEGPAFPTGAARRRRTPA